MQINNYKVLHFYNAMVCLIILCKPRLSFLWEDGFLSMHYIISYSLEKWFKFQVFTKPFLVV